MDGLLTEVKTVTHGQGSSSLSSVTESPRHNSLERRDARSKVDGDPTSLEYILTVLRSKPDQGALSSILATLDPSNKQKPSSNFDIRIAGPPTAQILNALVSVTIPDHWEIIGAKQPGSKSGNAKLRASLLRCLNSVAGISCLVAQLRTLISASRASSERAKASGCHIQLRNTLEVISVLLEPKEFSLRLYNDIESLHSSATQRQIAWKESLSLIAASRVLSTAAEALTLVDKDSTSTPILWIGEGPRYASWLGCNILHMTLKLDPDNQDGWKAVASLTGRALSLGYTDQVVREVYNGLLVDRDLLGQYNSLFDCIRPTEQLAVLEAVFRDIEKKFFSGEYSGDIKNNASSLVVSSVAALCSRLVGNRLPLQHQLLDWLSKGQGGSIQTAGMRRAIIASFARNQGHLQRLSPAAVKEVGRSSIFLNTVSNRLAASSTRARFLGMIIGTAISQLVEDQGKAMKFDLEEMESDDALWYLSLIKAEDAIGSLDQLRKTELLAPEAPKASKSSSLKNSSARPRTAKIVSIEEIESENESSEDEDLIPYEKPDGDPSDSDDDPTLVQRNKPTAPVYIRDLITYLRDTDNVESYELALTTAPSLIRRKTGFGTELAENIEELALITVGLQEQSKFPKFHEYRLQSMIALIVSQPLKMGKWFSAILFDGDLSQVQRSAVLTALGLSARELAGAGQQDAQALGLPALPDSSFPSKRLPANLEALYTNNESPIASLTKKLSQASLQPLAATAADAAAGPNALKVRTFSSRMEVEQRRQEREAQRQKSTIKDVHRVLSEGFFFPLKGRFEMMLIQFSSSTAPSYNPFFVPHILCLFIQTLTLVLSTMGPHNPFLPILTLETLTFLLSLHTKPISEDPSVLSALLAFFLAVVDLNVTSGSSGEERLVTEFATQIMELREWTNEVFDRTPPAQGDDPREQVRMLAAGVMVKLGEVIERYQGRLMGVNSGFKY
ncbi:telomere binding protein [Aspergillus nanangensis]|uniref:Telomere binding protein n=1 Tax=Aspergillus nanangensis TaxID=2582783 RepID=A0AAD4GNF1_ASPNN|nr:telomere binding protein [Aspergillus nanangensis]